MSPNITLYGRHTSDNVQKTLWMLGETGLPFTHIEKGGRFGGLDDADFLALNPHGRIPTLVVDGTVVWESAAIIRYLAAKFCADKFWPSNPDERAKIDQWMTWGCSDYYKDANRLFWLTIRVLPENWNLQDIEETHQRVVKRFALLESLLEERDALLDNFSMADIVIGTMLYRYFHLPVQRPEFKNITRWYNALTKRPGYQRYVMTSFEELRGRLEY